MRGKDTETSAWNWAVIGHQPVGVAQALPNQIVGGDKPSGNEVDKNIKKNTFLINNRLPVIFWKINKDASFLLYRFGNICKPYICKKKKSNQTLNKQKKVTNLLKGCIHVLAE